MTMKRMIGALMAPFVLVSNALAYDVSITPGTGNFGFDPPVTSVPEPNTAILILIGIVILAALSLWHDRKVLSRKR